RGHLRPWECHHTGLPHAERDLLFPHPARALGVAWRAARAHVRAAAVGGVPGLAQILRRAVPHARLAKDHVARAAGAAQAAAQRARHARLYQRGRTADMNLREGRIGRQEAACLAAFGVAVNGLVYPNDAALYAHGNAAYLAAPLSLLLLLPAFALVARAMERRASAHLGGFLCDALGGLAGRAAALAVIGYLIVSAAVPLIQ